MKRIICILMALALLSAVPVCAATPFSDVKQGDWFASYVETARDLGIVSGYPDGSFKPSRQVTYGEFLAMAMRGRGSDDPGSSGGHWAQKFYDAACSAGVFDETQIGPRFLDEPIPRRDMALVMAGVLSTSDLGGRNVKSADKLFTDVEGTDEREYPIALCAYYGALSGYPDGSFRPYGFLTRAEASAAMVALDGVLKQAGVEPEPLPEPQEPEIPETPQNPKPKADPKSREELLDREDEHAYQKTGDPEVLEFLAPEAREYLEAVIGSARFVKEGGKYLVRLQWPDLPEGYGSKIDVQVCDANGTGLDGYVWICRKGMEKMPTYRSDLKQAGGAEFVFDLTDLGKAGTVGLLVTLMTEDTPMESSLALAEQDLKTGKTSLQVKLASDAYQLSGTLPLADGVFNWK